MPFATSVTPEPARRIIAPRNENETLASDRNETEALLSRMQQDAHALRLRASLFLMGASLLAMVLAMVTYTPFVVAVAYVSPNSTESRAVQFYRGWTHAMEYYGWVPGLYVASGIFGAGNYLALYPGNLRLIQLNAAFQVYLFRAAYHGCVNVIFIVIILQISLEDPLNMPLVFQLITSFGFTIGFIIECVLAIPVFEHGLSGRVALARVWKAERFLLGYEAVLYATLRACGHEITPLWDTYFALEGLLSVVL